MSVCADSDWLRSRVDFVDGFGRERRCLRKDLPALKKMDERVTKSVGYAHMIMLT